MEALHESDLARYTGQLSIDCVRHRGAPTSSNTFKLIRGRGDYDITTARPERARLGWVVWRSRQASRWRDCETGPLTGKHMDRKRLPFPTSPSIHTPSNPSTMEGGKAADDAISAKVRTALVFSSFFPSFCLFRFCWQTWDVRTYMVARSKVCNSR